VIIEGRAMRHSEQLQKLAEQHPEVRRMMEQSALNELKRSIHMARIRCLKPSEVIDRLPGIMGDADRNELLFRLTEVDFSDDQIETIAEAVRELADYGEVVPSREKPRVDGTIARILQVLPQKTANELVRPMLKHRRRARREVAYKTLRRVGVTAETANDLIGVFRQTGDEKALELIARTASIAATDAEFLLQNLSEDYWRVRVLEALLLHHPRRAVELAADYPREFIWAVGRTKSVTHLTVLERMAATKRKDHELLSLYAWSLGQLGAKRQLEALAALIE
jgi:hypothetical protein